jgi:hypothetical protein
MDLDKVHDAVQRTGDATKAELAQLRARLDQLLNNGVPAERLG